MTYIKVENDRAQTQSSISWRSAGGVPKKVCLYIVYSLLNRFSSLFFSLDRTLFRNHENVLRDSRHTHCRYVNRIPIKQPSDWASGMVARIVMEITRERYHASDVTILSRKKWTRTSSVVWSYTCAVESRASVSYRLAETIEISRISFVNFAPWTSFDSHDHMHVQVIDFIHDYWIVCIDCINDHRWSFFARIFLKDASYCVSKFLDVI